MSIEVLGRLTTAVDQELCFAQVMRYCWTKKIHYDNVSEWFIVDGAQGYAMGDPPQQTKQLQV